jgi:hypothetical protein
MKSVESDALVFFGATGDLAYEQIFSAFHAMTRHSSRRIPPRSALDLFAKNQGHIASGVLQLFATRFRSAGILLRCSGEESNSAGRRHPPQFRVRRTPSENRGRYLFGSVLRRSPQPGPQLSDALLA